MKSVIAILGVPRSGTSWLGEIFNSLPQTIYKYQPLFSYAFKDALNVRSDKKDIERFFTKLTETEDAFLDRIELRDKDLLPKFQKDYKQEKILVFKEVRYLYVLPRLLEVIPELKAVLIRREVVDTLNSWINAPREFKPEWNILEEWYFAQKKNEFKPENYYGYSKWKEAMALFHSMEKQYPQNVIITRYETLNRNPIDETRRIFTFCGLDILPQTEEFIRQSRMVTKDNEYSVYRDQKRKQQENVLPVTIKNLIKEDLKRLPV